MFVFFFISRKLKLFDSWVDSECEKAPCYTSMAILWPIGIIGGIFTYLFNITK
jgi:hypothetical protein